MLFWTLITFNRQCDSYGLGGQTEETGKERPYLNDSESAEFRGENMKRRKYVVFRLKINLRVFKNYKWDEMKPIWALNWENLNLIEIIGVFTAGAKYRK